MIKTQRTEGSNPLEGASLPPLPVEHLQFQSLSEFACAKMLQSYCDWRPIPGTTFQVPIGRTYFDFRHQYKLIEYHPLSIRHECLTDVVSVMMKASRNLPKPTKAALLTALSGELEAQYAKRRAQIAAAHPTYKDFEVICLSGPESFCSFIQTFASRPAPAHEELMKEFRKLRKEGRRVMRG